MAARVDIRRYVVGVRGTWTSPPARGRGLKQNHPDVSAFGGWSPPARGRGLKPGLARKKRMLWRSPPARGRGLKRPVGLRQIFCRGSPPARGRGLKHCTATKAGREVSRPSRGGVDWNAFVGVLFVFVVPSVGTWIETRVIRNFVPPKFRKVKQPGKVKQPTKYTIT